MNISAVPNRTVNTELDELTPLVMIKPQGNQTNSNLVTSQEPKSNAPSSSSGKPTDGGRETTTADKPGWQQVKDEVDARLAEAPDYLEALAKYETHKNIANDFAIVDAACWFGPNDGKLGYDDVRTVANDPAQTPQARAAAARLLADMSIWNEASQGDQQLTTKDCMEFLAKLQGSLKDIRAAVTEEVKAERGMPTRQPTATTNSATAQPSSSAPVQGGKPIDAAEMDRSNPKPAPSAFSGLEGASENLNNMIAWGEGEIDRLTTLMGKTDDPAQLKQLENKINQMTRRMQQMTALLNQVMTAMQNISKMYSDITMNAVRNMR